MALAYKGKRKYLTRKNNYRWSWIWKLWEELLARVWSLCRGAQTHAVSRSKSEKGFDMLPQVLLERGGTGQRRGEYGFGLIISKLYLKCWGPFPQNDLAGALEDWLITTSSSAWNAESHEMLLFVPVSGIHWKFSEGRSWSQTVHMPFLRYKR